MIVKKHYKYSELTSKIIGSRKVGTSRAMTVHNALGNGFKKSFINEP